MDEIQREEGKNEGRRKERKMDWMKKYEDSETWIKRRIEKEKKMNWRKKKENENGLN